MKLMNWF